MVYFVKSNDKVTVSVMEVILGYKRSAQLLILTSYL